MALFNVNYGSDVMNKYMGMNVIIPEGNSGVKDSDGKYAVLYLLHGYTDDYTKWCRMTSIERYANETGIAVVMPDAGKSFYMDMAHGDPYFTYITEEVPAYVQKWLPITTDPEFTHVAGLSMGGYGAMKIALTYPERFKSAGCFSGVLAMAQTAMEPIAVDAEQWIQRLATDIPLAFGDVTQIADGPNDLFWLAAQAKIINNNIPNLYISCGMEDFLHSSAVGMRDYLGALEIPCTFHEAPGVHDWGFWDVEVKRYLELIVK